MSGNQPLVWHLDEYTDALGETTPGGRLLARQIAGPGARFLAGALDFLLQCIIGAIIGFAVYVRHPSLVPPGDRLWFFAAAVVEWHVLYFVLFEAFAAGRTPGKAAIGLAVVDVRTGKRARPIQLVCRNLLRVVDLLPFQYIVAWISMALSPSRQRIGDRLCSTCVIYVRSLVEQLQAAGVPETIFSTSEDGYLLEAFLQRRAALHESVRPFLTKEVAQYFQTKYPATDAGLNRLFEQELYGDYLEMLYRQESEAPAPTSEPHAEMNTPAT